MVDFSKKLSALKVAKKIDPIEIYDSLDRASDKGPLRPSQESVLRDWFTNFKDKKDIIIKLHTGQGKTLLGLLMLQSKLNEGKGPVLYLCPNKYLVEQTCDQAKKFGIKFSQVDKQNQIPQDFWDAKTILITHTQVLFNGLTKFRLRQNSIHIDTIVLDDSHACIDTIQDAFSIKLGKEEPAFKEILSLFETDLEEQGEARIQEIKAGDFDSFLPVPYWAWQSKQKEVIALLIKYKENQRILFAWELIKDIIRDCQCIISGAGLEILPYSNPIDLFGSFYKAEHRIFMSATTNNDSFFIKGLGVGIDTINNPITYNHEKWSGEKMILVPYLMHEDLGRVTIVNAFGRPNDKRSYGVVALTPSMKDSMYWEQCGAIKSDSNTIEAQINLLKEKKFERTIAIANRYDGIDLPDDMCRILILDSKPYAQSLSDRLQESYRSNSKVLDVKLAQKIEQGLGRGVRGEKDYCVVLITGHDLIGMMRNPKLKKYFSAQTNKQIEIGFESTEFGVEEAKSSDGLQILSDLITLSLKRDEGWKSFYTERMNEIETKVEDFELLEILDMEGKAEHLYSIGEYQNAIKVLQTLIDKYIPTTDKTERGWYLQEMARYAYPYSRIESNSYQVSAYKTNRYLLKPTNGIEFQKLKINKTRNESIIGWIKQHDSFEELKMKVYDLTHKLSFGVKADKFEEALCEIGKALGFASERPDKEHKKGPDNLWNTQAGDYILFECKNEVDERRSEINKSETGQMNVSCAWFKENYNGEVVKNIMIFPANKIAGDGAFNHDVEVLRKHGLSKLTNNIRNFFNEFKDYDINTLTEKQIEEALFIHKLTIPNILNDYTDKIKR